MVARTCVTLLNIISETMSTAMAKLLQVVAFALVHSTRAVLFVAASPNYFRKPKRCPKLTNKLLLKSARTLAEMIRKREVTSETVIKSYISRIKEVNPVLNAVVEDRFKLAIKEARTVDKMLSTTKLTVNEIKQKYPLLGLPLTVKESIAVEGCSNSSGVVLSEPRRAKVDAPVVKLCREAGAIPIALTNTPELCINFETYNNVTGVTNNPFDTRRTTGGSSGGEGSLLGAGASVIGLGSDLFGSIRIPAHFCGVWGHKPGSHVVAYEGHNPTGEFNNIWTNSFTMGPITRYACDLSLLMQVIQKKPVHGVNGKKVPMESVKIYYMEGKGGSSLSHAVDKEIVCAIRNLINCLSKKSYCKKVDIEEFKKSGDYTFPLIIALVNDADSSFDDSKYVKELFKYLTGRSDFTLMMVLCMFARQLSRDFVNPLISGCLQNLEDMKKKVCKILGENGVLVFPTHPTPATYHNQCFGKLDDYTYTGIFNFLGLPVTQCPIGFTSKGLPIGIQVVGTPNNDSLTIDVAEVIEKELGGWKPPIFV